MSGKFFVFEGLDGSGTTTQSRLLFNKLSRHTPLVHLTAEPSTGPVGQLIRQIIKGRLIGRTITDVKIPFDYQALALLFAADRLDHVACEIRPLLEQGYHVISDRYVLSSLAYQGLTSPSEWVACINSHALKPDIQFFLDVPASTAWERLNQARPGSDIFEAPETLTQVAQSYQESLKTLSPETLCVIDGTKSLEEIEGEIWQTLTDRKLINLETELEVEIITTDE
ncbi:MAG TPA: dTMP kinase [Myxococcota bacterium]|nr:dTMP kinase [Myxococcota bacterium]